MEVTYKIRHPADFDCMFLKVQYQGNHLSGNIFPMSNNRDLNKQIALPSDHGSWVFLLSPLIIGVFAGRKFTGAHGWLILSALAVFMLRQPASFLVKSLSGRRSSSTTPVALFWLGFYGLICLAGIAGLVVEQAAYLLWLAIPGMAVFGWHLWLVSKRQERRQMGVDILGSGALALAAPAAYWIAAGGTDPLGWWLWILTWLQSAASIVYAFLRLDQRVLKEKPDRPDLWQMGRRALLYSGFNLGLTIIGSAAGWLPLWIWIPFLLQFLEVVWGTLNPAVGWKPTAVGFRQLAVSSLFTVMFVLLW